MKHGLPGGSAVSLVNRQPLRRKGVANGARQPRDGSKYRRRLCIVQPKQVIGVRFERYQHVPGIHLPDVHERQRVGIFLDHGRGDLLRHDPAKNAIAHPSPPAA